MNAIKGVIIEFYKQNPLKVLHDIQVSWRETREFSLPSGFFHRIIHYYGDDSFIAGSLTFERAKSAIILNLEAIPLGFTLKTSSGWWSQFELICEECGGKGTGVLMFTLHKLIVYKAPPPESKDLEILADGSPTYVFRVGGKLQCSKCQRVVQINYPSKMQ
jgi:hypothetical protein